MSSPAQAAASAANAVLSTGPRTDAGKARSSRNAVKHGLTSRQLVIAPGEEEEFAEFHGSLLAQLAPEGALEMGLFNMLVHAGWNLQRFRTLEAQLMTNGIESLLDESTAKALDRLQRYAASNQRSYYSALKELRTVQTNRFARCAMEGREDPAPELVSVAALSKQAAQQAAERDATAWRAMEAYINAPLPGRMQNEPASRAPASRQEVA